MFALATINVSNQATNPFVSLLDFVGKDQYGALQALDSMFLGHMKENFAGRIWTHDRSQSIEDFIWGEVDDPDDFPLDY